MQEPVHPAGRRVNSLDLNLRRQQQRGRRTNLNEFEPDFERLSEERGNDVLIAEEGPADVGNARDHDLRQTVASCVSLQDPQHDVESVSVSKHGF
jgi:hypothetical protein